MAKTKKRPKEAPTPSPVSGVGKIEEVVIDVTGKANRLFRDFQAPILIAGVAVVAIIGVWGLIRAYERKQERDWSAQIHDLMTGTDEEIQRGYGAVLEDLKGTRNEPFAVCTVVNWLKESDPQEALRILKDALDRHPEEMLLTLHTEKLETAIAENEAFRLPDPFAPPPFPGPLVPERLEMLLAGEEGAESPLSTGPSPAAETPPGATLPAPTPAAAPEKPSPEPDGAAPQNDGNL